MTAPTRPLRLGFPCQGDGQARLDRRVDAEEEADIDEGLAEVAE
jgi:hypothetical protein